MRHWIKAAGLAALAGCLAAPGSANAGSVGGVPFGPAFTVDTDESLPLSAPKVASNAVGGTAAVWQDFNSSDSTSRVHARRFSFQGDAIGPESVIGPGRGPAVAMSANSAVVIVFADASGNLSMTLFDPSGTKVVDAQAIVPGGTALPASVGMDANGNFAVPFFKTVSGAKTVQVQRFNADGTTNGNSIVVATEDTTGSPKLAMAATGGFVVAWINGATGPIHARWFNADGTPASDVVLVNPTDVVSTQDVRVAMDGVGNTAVAWNDSSAPAHQIEARFFGPDGTAQTDQIVVVDDGAGNGVNVGDVSRSATGETVFTWDTRGAQLDVLTPSDVFMRRYGPANSPRDPGPVQVNANRPRPHQVAPSVALDADGDFTVVWQDGDSGSVGQNILGRRFVGPENVDLGITLTDSPDPVAGGATLTYTATVANEHPPVAPIPGSSAGITTTNGAIGSAHNVSVTFTLPDGATNFQSASSDWTCQPDGSNFRCDDHQLLLPGAQASLPISFNAPTNASSVQGTATLTAYQRDSDVANNSASTTTTVGPGTGNGQTVQFAVDAESHAESDPPFTITITMSATSTQPVVVHYSTSGSAVKGTDYTVTPDGSVTIPVGQTSASLNVTLIDNSTPQASRTAVFTITQVDNAVLGTPSSNTLTIVDDDNGVGGSSEDVQAANGQSVTFTTSSGSFAALARTDQPADAPAGLDYPLGFFSYQINGVPANAVLTLTVALPAGTDASDWINCPGTSCLRMNRSDSTAPGNVQISGDTVTVEIQDNGPGDDDPRAGFVSATVAPAKVKTSSGGALGWMTLVPLFGVAAARRRRKA